MLENERDCNFQNNRYVLRVMKSKLLVHGVWACAAIIALSLGWQSGKPATDNSALSGTEVIGAMSNTFGATSTRSPQHRPVARTRKEDAESALEGLFGKIATGNPNLEILATQAFQDSNPITRRLAFSRLLEALTPENAEEIRGHLITLGADGDQWRDFHYSWGAMSGKAAFDHATTSREQDLAATMTGWAAANPTEALAMLGNLPAEVNGQRDELIASIVSGLAHRDSAMAADLVMKLAREGNGQAGELMEIVAREALRTQGPEQASVWAESLPEGPLKGSAMSRIAEAYARKSPQAAAAWAARFANKDYASSAIEVIGGRWAETDPTAAVNWLVDLPAGSGQNAGLSRAFSDWEDRDPAAAGEYLLAMPHSQKRDAAISGFATGYAWQNPQLAIAWAQDIRDPALRQSSITRAGQAYFRVDPTGAQAWMETSGLSQTAQQEIRQGRR